MQDGAVLYPAFALVAWTFVMAGVMLRTAFRAVADGLSPEYFRHGTGANPPGYMRSAYQHYSNLFEMPVLFYMGILVIYVTEQGTFVLIGLGWLYVAARVVHSLVHLKNTNIPRRRDTFLVSVATLIAIWVILFARVITS